MLLQVAVPVPMRMTFVYNPPSGCIPNLNLVGVRVRVPFGRRNVVGIVWGCTEESNILPKQIKTAACVLDTHPIVTAPIQKLCQLVSEYYHYPIGEVISCALPRLLRSGKSTELIGDKGVKMTVQAKNADLCVISRRAPRQAALLEYLEAVGGWASQQQLAKAGFSSGLRKALLEKKYLEISPALNTSVKPDLDVKSPLDLSKSQADAVQAVSNCNAFKSFLLDGVTGSGKTEVYLRLIAQVIQQGRQGLLLVPEIGLTPQMVQRVQSRFLGRRVIVLHSALTDRERHDSWLRAWRGEVDIVIGTRSAIFVPLQALGIIIIDEEHDGAYSQLSGCRYSARDVAVMRAKIENIPIVLGSATPSLESWHNIKQKRYQHLRLPQRAGSAQLPTFHTIDLRGRKLLHGLSTELLQAIDKHLSAGQQILLFLNRRGFAPVLLCNNCGWQAKCQYCDARMTLHCQPERLYCHHCGAAQCVPKQCPACSEMQLQQVGVGTERLEQTLRQHYPDVPITRIDRDTVRGSGRKFSELLKNIHQNNSHILCGTQMLAKGHHFPHVTMVGILDVDYGLCSSDFRALEHMSQLILQVAGRAGRGEQSGEVYLQTRYIDHPMLQALLRSGYHTLMDHLLVERKQAQLPPLAYLAVWHIESKVKQKSEAAAEVLAQHIAQYTNKQVNCIGPIPAVMMKRANYYRMQLWLCSTQRSNLHQLLNQVLNNWPKLNLPSSVHCTLDVDPVTCN